jgi:cytochrome c oxidase subunit IV
MKLAQAIPFRAYTLSWVALLGLTTITYELGSHTPSKVLMIVVLMLTLIKGQLVVSYFMDLHRVRLLWRLIMTSYLVIVGSVIAIAYLTV